MLRFCFYHFAEVCVSLLVSTVIFELSKFALNFKH